jgi:hypothetical protein
MRDDEKSPNYRQTEAVLVPWGRGNSEQILQAKTEKME